MLLRALSTLIVVPGWSSLGAWETLRELSQREERDAGRETRGERRQGIIVFTHVHTSTQSGSGLSRLCGLGLLHRPSPRFTNTIAKSALDTDTQGGEQRPERGRVLSRALLPAPALLDSPFAASHPFGDPVLPRTKPSSEEPPGCGRGR